MTPKMRGAVFSLGVAALIVAGAIGFGGVTAHKWESNDTVNCGTAWVGDTGLDRTYTYPVRYYGNGQRIALGAAEAEGVGLRNNWQQAQCDLAREQARQAPRDVFALSMFLMFAAFLRSPFKPGVTRRVLLRKAS